MSLHDLYVKYRERVEFLLIYIREAHPVDGWWLGKGIPGLYLKLSGSKAATDVYDPETMEERRSVAGRCETALGYDMQTWVDEMDDRVGQAYAAMPTPCIWLGWMGEWCMQAGWGRLGSSRRSWGQR